MSPFFSPYRHQFIRVGACVPQVAVTEPRRNADNVLGLLAEGDKARVALMVFPELCLSAYAIDDLLFQDAVLGEVALQVDRLICASGELFPIFVVGAPLRSQGHLYNCGVVIHRGALLGVVPKVFLPNYREFYERRHFTSGDGMVDRSRSPAVKPRSAAICCLLHAAVRVSPFMSRSARICGSRNRRARLRRSPAQRSC